MCRSVAFVSHATTLLVWRIMGVWRHYPWREHRTIRSPESNHNPRKLRTLHGKTHEEMGALVPSETENFWETKKNEEETKRERNK
jgi:hypothetical protein